MKLSPTLSGSQLGFRLQEFIDFLKKSWQPRNVKKSPPEKCQRLCVGLWFTDFLILLDGFVDKDLTIELLN